MNHTQKYTSFRIRGANNAFSNTYLSTHHHHHHHHHHHLIHVVCLTTGPQPVPKPVIHQVRSSDSSFKFQYVFFLLRSSYSCLRLLRLPIPSITCFRSQFLGKMWPILRFIVCRMFLSPWPHVIFYFSHYRSNWISPSVSKAFKVFLYFPKCPSFSTTQSYDPKYHFTVSFLHLCLIF